MWSQTMLMLVTFLCALQPIFADVAYPWNERHVVIDLANGNQRNEVDKQSSVDVAKQSSDVAKLSTDVGKQADDVARISLENGDSQATGLGSHDKGQGSDVQGQGSGVKGQGNDVQGQDNDVKGQGNDVKGQGSDVQGQASDVKGQGDNVQGQGSDVKDQGDDVQGQSSDVSQDIDVKGQDARNTPNEEGKAGKMAEQDVKIGPVGVFLQLIGLGALTKTVPDPGLANDNGKDPGKPIPQIQAGGLFTNDAKSKADSHGVKPIEENVQPKVSSLGELIRKADPKGKTDPWSKVDSWSKNDPMSKNDPVSKTNSDPSDKTELSKVNEQQQSMIKTLIKSPFVSIALTKDQEHRRPHVPAHALYYPKLQAEPNDRKESSFIVQPHQDKPNLQVKITSVVEPHRNSQRARQPGNQNQPASLLGSIRRVNRPEMIIEDARPQFLTILGRKAGASHDDSQSPIGVKENHSNNMAYDMNPLRHASAPHITKTDEIQPNVMEESNPAVHNTNQPKPLALSGNQPTAPFQIVNHSKTLFQNENQPNTPNQNANQPNPTGRIENQPEPQVQNQIQTQPKSPVQIGNPPNEGEATEGVGSVHNDPEIMQSVQHGHLAQISNHHEEGQPSQVAAGQNAHIDHAPQPGPVIQGVVMPGVSDMDRSIQGNAPVVDRVSDGVPVVHESIQGNAPVVDRVSDGVPVVHESIQGNAPVVDRVSDSVSVIHGSIQGNAPVGQHVEQPVGPRHEIRQPTKQASSASNADGQERTVEERINEGMSEMDHEARDFHHQARNIIRMARAIHESNEPANANNHGHGKRKRQSDQDLEQDQDLDTTSKTIGINQIYTRIPLNKTSIKNPPKAEASEHQSKNHGKTLGDYAGMVVGGGALLLVGIVLAVLAVTKGTDAKLAKKRFPYPQYDESKDPNRIIELDFSHVHEKEEVVVEDTAPKINSEDPMGSF